MTDIRSVFVGGTGRSGTSTMASIIARHPDFSMTPEVRLHTRANGLIDVLEGHITPAAFAKLARGSWFYRWIPGEAPVGVHRMIDERTWFRLIDRYEETFTEEPEAASRAVLRGILDPIAVERNASGWVEHSPVNGRRADGLYRLFPDMKLVHTVRDGRDTARSMTKQSWGPDSTEDALAEWATRLREVHRATAAVPADRVLVVRWEELVDRDREGQLQRVLDFLEIKESQQMRSFFDKSVHADGAHIGRWRKELGTAEAERVDKLYREILDGMRADGVACLPIDPD